MFCVTVPSNRFIVGRLDGAQVGSDLGSQLGQSCEPAESDAASGMNDI